MTERAPRKDRVEEERPRVWRPPSLLPPPKEEDGYKFRYIRMEVAGETDKRNMSTRLREGWVPVTANEQPEIAATLGLKGTDHIEVGGVVLCKMPAEMVAQRRQYYADVNAAQMDSVNNSVLRDNDPSNPIRITSRDRVSRGKGFGTGGS